LRVDRRLYEARISQHAQMLGYRGLREIERRLEIADGALATGKESQDGAATRLGEDSECGFHGTYIPRTVYTCQRKCDCRHGNGGLVACPQLCAVQASALRKPIRPCDRPELAGKSRHSRKHAPYVNQIVLFQKEYVRVVSVLLLSPRYVPAF
jgi:hypothetical protein